MRLTLALSRLLAPFEARDKDRCANDARVEFDAAKFVSALQSFQKSLAYAGSDDSAPKQNRREIGGRFAPANSRSGSSRTEPDVAAW